MKNLISILLAALPLFQVVRADPPNDATANKIVDLVTAGFHHRELNDALAAFGGKIDILQDANGQSPLYISASHGQYEDVALELLAGANPNARDAQGRTPLLATLSEGGPDQYFIMEMLAYKGGDVDGISSDGDTPLSFAARRGDLRAASFLLWLGATVVPPGIPQDKQPVFIAEQHGDSQMVDLLHAAVASAPVSRKDTAALGIPAASILRRFADASRAGDLNGTEQAIMEGADINKRDDHGFTALARAVGDGHADLVTMLLMDGADPNTAANDGRTPLMSSMQFVGFDGKRIELMLILAGANVNAVTRDGNTALSYAVSERNNFAVPWMIWRGADVHMRTHVGNLMQIAQGSPDWPSMMDLLKSYGLVGEPAKPLGLIDAIRAGDVTRVKALVAQGAPVEAPDSKGSAPLCWAACWGRWEMVDYLMAHGANINRINPKNGRSVLHELTVMGNPSGDPHVLAQPLIDLIKRGANPNLASDKGFTPLMLGARYGCGVIKMTTLLDSGANVNARNVDGKTALDLARDYGHTDLAAVLQQRGGVE